MSDVTRAVDIDLRLVRYFVGVAEHAHFGRAASALRVGQPSLSRQIRVLERQVGVRLLERDTRGTRLSEAGEAFLPRALQLLRNADEAAAVARAAGGAGTVTIGHAPGTVVAPVARELRRLFPDSDVRLVHLGWRGPAEELAGHRVDAVIARLPFRTTHLCVTPVYDEPRVVVVGRDHRLADRPSVVPADLAREARPRLLGCDPACSEFWRLEPATDEIPLDSLDDAWEVVALGDAVAVATRSMVPAGRDDLVTIPLRSAAPARVVLATRADDERPVLAALRSHGPRLLRAPA